MTSPSNPNVLLIPAAAFRARMLRPVFPIGLYSMKEVAFQAGFDVHILDFAGRDETQVLPSTPAIGDAILSQFDPSIYDIIGLSTVGGTFSISIYLAERIKEIHPHAAVVMGGPHASFLASEILADFPFVDAVVIGEGEITFVEMLRAFRRSADDWRCIPGVMTRGSPFVSRALIEDLNSLPIPGYAVDLCKRDTPEYVRTEALRGCFAKCQFCATTQFWEGRVRRRSPARLLEGMKNIAGITNIQNFLFIGDNFSYPIKAFRETCQYLIEAKSKFMWGCALRIGDLRNDDLRLLKDAGCRSIFVGVESASQATLNKIHKKINLVKTLSMIEEALRLGFDIGASQIVGFPWETEEDVFNTLIQHNRFLESGMYSNLNALMPIPGAKGFPESPLIMDIKHIMDNLPCFCKDRYSLELITHFPHYFSLFGYYETPYLRHGVLTAMVETADQLKAMKEKKNSVGDN